MKLTAFILVVGCLMAGLQGKAQIVTISVKEEKLESVLKLFKKQTGYSFFVDEPTLKKASESDAATELCSTGRSARKMFCRSTGPRLFNGGKNSSGLGESSRRKLLTVPDIRK